MREAKAEVIVCLHGCLAGLHQLWNVQPLSPIPPYYMVDQSKSKQTRIRQLVNSDGESC